MKLTMSQLPVVSGHLYRKYTSPSPILSQLMKGIKIKKAPSHLPVVCLSMICMLSCFFASTDQLCFTKFPCIAYLYLGIEGIKVNWVAGRHWQKHIYDIVRVLYINFVDRLIEDITGAII